MAFPRRRRKEMRWNRECGQHAQRDAIRTPEPEHGRDALATPRTESLNERNIAIFIPAPFNPPDVEYELLAIPEQT